MMMPDRTQVTPEHYSACWLLHEYAPDVKLPAVARTMETDEEALSPEQVEMEERI